MTENPNPVTPPAQPPTPATPPAQGEERRFTQAEVDVMMGERAKRAAEAAITKLLTDVGYENIDGLKKDTVEARKKREAEMSEAQKAQADAEAARKERDEYKATLEAERQQRKIDKRDNAVITAAQKARAQDDRDVLLWAREYQREQLEKAVSEDGTVDEKAVNAIIEACRLARKNWFTGSAPGSPSNSDGHSPQPDPSKAIQGMTIPRL
jgi:hypothetical protein